MLDRGLFLIILVAILCSLVSSFFVVQLTCLDALVPRAQQQKYSRPSSMIRQDYMIDDEDTTILYDNDDDDSNYDDDNNNYRRRIFDGLAEPSLIIRKYIWEQVMIDLPTVVSKQRLALTMEIAYTVLSRNIPGDFVECGVYQGGASILMVRALQQWERVSSYDNIRRKFYAFDSFEGMPEPTRPDLADPSFKGEKGEFKAGQDVFEYYMDLFKTKDERVIIVKGWFADTLPRTNINHISFLRLDGDLYESTLDALTHLYSRVSQGGIVYIDDYASRVGCATAVHEFRRKHNIKATLFTQRLPDMDTSGTFEAVFWFKE
eukprot:TRINITY_DN5412_c0_g1_i1.p1 TRINITY_DN5412_c0_g1~~TRINITY_DN5412_c0_g1_i1.p1  ORF type:complete len:319 (-),score=60.82 TRINITY_DN5412_c0_g1_i1:9-965(-)